MATFLEPTQEGFEVAGEQLRQGRLLSFPTETVYGLGANALDAAATLSIFEAKGRPLTDPLIVHTPTIATAKELLQLSPVDSKVFDVLAHAFWPGPLTLIGKAVDALPSTVSAGTGFVGLRVPSHPIAHQLLVSARVPVAAPSANRFGHVSPTTAKHVMDDLGHCANLKIIQMNDSADTRCCDVGIESTVVKIVPDEAKVIIYRRGGVSEVALTSVLEQNKESIGVYAIENVQNKAGTTEKVEAQEAPGQLLTHYAPDVDTFLVQDTAAERWDTASMSDLGSCAVIDFHGRLRHLQSQVAAYEDLSPEGDVRAALPRIFELLRWSEGVPNVTKVLVSDVLYRTDHEHSAALHDRMFRAASGKRIRLV